MEKISRKIREIQKDRNLSDNAFAKSIGMSSTGFSQMLENGSIKLATVVKISERYGVSLPELLGLDYQQSADDEAAELIRNLQDQINELRKDKEFLKSLVIDRMGKVWADVFTALGLTSPRHISHNA